MASGTGPSGTRADAPPLVRLLDPRGRARPFFPGHRRAKLPGEDLVITVNCLSSGVPWRLWATSASLPSGPVSGRCPRASTRGHGGVNPPQGRLARGAAHRPYVADRLHVSPIATSGSTRPGRLEGSALGEALSTGSTLRPCCTECGDMTSSRKQSAPCSRRADGRMREMEAFELQTSFVGAIVCAVGWTGALGPPPVALGQPGLLPATSPTGCI